MLDQNTDRMWFVIGAVIVGAAIIFIANGTMPEIFASVSESFGKSAQEATSVVDGISLGSQGNMLSLPMFKKGTWVVINDDENRVNVVPGSIQDRLGSAWRHTSTDFIPVDGGQSYTFTSPQRLVNKRVAFYDENKDYIWGDIRLGIYAEFTLDSPSNARYAIISSEHIDRDTNKEVSVYSWWFGKTEDRQEVN